MRPISGRGREVFGILVASLLLHAARVGADTVEPVKILRAYGPGGPDRALRFTSVALTRRTPQRQTAGQFIAFLKSPQARRIFVDHGWD